MNKIFLSLRILASEAVLEGFIEFLFCLLDHNGVRMTKSMRPMSHSENITFYVSDMLHDLFRVVNYELNI